MWPPRKDRKGSVTPQAKGDPNGCPQKLLRDTQKQTRTASSEFRGIVKSNTLRYESWLRAQMPGAGVAIGVVRPVTYGGRLFTPVPDRPPLCISCQDRLPMGAPARPEAFSTRKRRLCARGRGYIWRVYVVWAGVRWWTVDRRVEGCVSCARVRFDT